MNINQEARQSRNRRTVETPSGEVATYLWSFENQQVGVELPSDERITYTYAPVTLKADELRVQRETEAGTTVFLWDGENILREYDDLGATEAEYTLNPQPYGHLVSQHREAESSFYQFDALGSTAALSDDTGTITDSTFYQAFGQVLAPTGTTANPFQWIGQLGYYFDAETGQQSLRRRQYEPGQGRFNSEDPSSELETDARPHSAMDSQDQVDKDENLFQYASNNPLNFRDPSGLFEWEKTFELFLTEYGEEGIALLQWAWSEGWGIDKRQYGWLSLRHDWWLARSEKVIAIGDTDAFGLTIRSDANAAKQLIEALRGLRSEVVAAQRQQQELDYLFKGYSSLPWYKRIHRLFAGVALNSWIGSGIKNVEQAWTGETLLGEKLGDSDRALLATLGSVETLLVAVPAAKGLTAAGAKLGLGPVGGAAVTRMMAADITFGLGRDATERMLQTAAGKAFIKAYAKVYRDAYVVAFRRSIEARIQELVKGYTGKLSRELYEQRGRTIFHNRIQGKISEKVFQQLLGGETKTFVVRMGGKKGTRHVDNVLDNTAREVKSGPLKLTKFIREQIRKDKELIKQYGLEIEWHLFAGGDEAAITALRQAGIKVITCQTGEPPMARRPKPTAEMRESFREFAAEVPALLRELQGVLQMSRNYHHVTVGFDDDSIRQVEAFYLDVLTRKERPDIPRGRLDRCYDAYIGEVLIARAGGEWVICEDDFSFGDPAIETEGRITVAPARRRRLQAENRKPFLWEMMDYRVNQEKYEAEMFEGLDESE